jgi:hypothetical protein
VYQQSSTGKSPPAVIFRCGSHAFCTASVRLRTTTAGTFVLEGSVDSHAETFLLQTRGISPDWIAKVDSLLDIHKGNPVAVYNELLGGEDADGRDYWDGTEEGKLRLPSKQNIIHRQKYLKSKSRTNLSVTSVGEAREFAESMRCPSTKEEIEALPPCQAFCVYFAFSEQYGSVFVLCNNNYGNNMLEEVNQHDLEGIFNPCCMCFWV